MTRNYLGRRGRVKAFGLLAALGAFCFASTGCAASTAVQAPAGAADQAMSGFLIARESLETARSACGLPALSINGGDAELVPGSGLTSREYVSRLLILACNAGFRPAVSGPVELVLSSRGDVPTAVAVTGGGREPWRKVRGQEPRITAAGSVVLEPSRASFLLDAVLEWMLAVDPATPRSAADLFAWFCGGSTMEVDQTPTPPASAIPFRLIAADDVLEQTFGPNTRIEWGESWPAPARFEAPAPTVSRGGATALARLGADGILSVQPIFLKQTIRRTADPCRNTYDLDGAGLSTSDRSGLQARLTASDQKVAASPSGGTRLCFAYEAVSAPSHFVSTSAAHVSRTDGLFTLVVVQASTAQASQILQMNSFLLTRPDDRGAGTCHRAVRQYRGDRNAQ